jgi:signal transduction histidine kinase
MRNYSAKDGRLFLCGNKGYYSFKPDELEDDRKPPLLNFTRFKIGNQEITAGEGSVLKDPIWLTNSIRLNYRQNTISFEFVGVDFQGQGDIKYLYKLENYDDEWRDVGTEAKATFFNLPPGKYMLQVKAVNSDGAVVLKSIVITITPPWWKTWWAYCLYGLLIILTGYLIYKYQRAYIVKRERERTQQKELAQAKEIEKAYTQLKSTQAQLIQSEKMASLGELTAGIAHEIQNPLNFVNNFSELNQELLAELNEEIEKGNLAEVKNIAQSVIDNEEKILYHGKRADAIVKGMLQHSRSSNNQKEPTNINALADEYLRLAYHGLRAKDKSFNATMKTDFDASIGNVNVIPQDIGRVILNLITNAFYAVQDKKKTADAGYEPTVTISTASVQPPLGGRSLSIKVSDNGGGIPLAILDKIFQPFFTTKPTGQGTGLGLSMSYDIITKGHGGELKVETKEGEGTSFIIQIPVN